MGPADELRAVALSLIGDGKDPDASARAAELLKAAAEIDKDAAESSKLQLEREKLQAEMIAAPSNRQTELWKTIAVVDYPLISILVLGGAVVQYFNGEAARRETAEDARWSTAIHAAATCDKLTASILLKAFLRSDRYRDDARAVAVNLMLQHEDVEMFRDVFGSTFQPLSWESVPQIVALDRSLSAIMNPLADRILRSPNGVDPLTTTERREYDSRRDAVAYLCGQLATVLRKPPPNGATVDLSQVQVGECDFSDVHLSGADLTGFVPSRVEFSRADLSAITKFAQSDWATSDWWQAAQISPELLRYLEDCFPYTPDGEYGAIAPSPESYVRGLARLGRSASPARDCATPSPRERPASKPPPAAKPKAKPSAKPTGAG